MESKNIEELIALLLQVNNTEDQLFGGILDFGEDRGIFKQIDKLKLAIFEKFVNNKLDTDFIVKKYDYSFSFSYGSMNTAVRGFLELDSPQNDMYNTDRVVSELDDLMGETFHNKEYFKKAMKIFKYDDFGYLKYTLEDNKMIFTINSHPILELMNTVLGTNYINEDVITHKYGYSYIELDPFEFIKLVDFDDYYHNRLQFLTQEHSYC